MTHRNRHFFALFAFLLIALLPGCDSLEGPEGPTGPILTGDLVGFAYLFSGATDNSGITATVEGTNISAVTGADGRWVLSDLPMGTYTISATKAGCGTTKQMGYLFVGGGQVWFGNLSVCELPACTVTGLTATPVQGGVTVSGTITSDARSNGRLLYYFIGNTASVSSDPATYTSNFGVDFGAVTTFSIKLQRFDFYGFASGQTAYLVVYGTNPAVITYVDMATNRWWYAGLSPTPSNVVSVVVP